MPIYDAVSLGNRFSTFLKNNMPSPSMVWGTSAHSVAHATFSKTRNYFIPYTIVIFVVLHITRGLGSPLFNKFTRLWFSGPAVNSFSEL